MLMILPPDPTLTAASALVVGFILGFVVRRRAALPPHDAAFRDLLLRLRHPWRYRLTRGWR